MNTSSQGRSPFLIFPWDKAFLPQLQQTVVQRTGGRPGDALIIVPHNRPRRYLREFFLQDKSLSRPLLLPRMLTVSEMIGLFRARITSRPLRTAGTLDRVALLHGCVRDVAVQEAVRGQEGDLSRRFADMDMARFFPWGLRLASVLEECLTQQLEAKDIPYTEGEVSPLASALLGALGRIHARYMEVLEEEGWTTPGLDAFRAAGSVQDAFRAAGSVQDAFRAAGSGQDASEHNSPIPALLRSHSARHVFIAGLAVLSDAENALLRCLWEDGAHICLHTDPALADPANSALHCHWACVDHVRWMRQWKAKGEMACAPSGRTPALHFLAGYDVHSQLLAVQRVLQPSVPSELSDTNAPPPSTAVVLAQSGLLMPTLHHLPGQDFNVSMGYPLERAPLCRLLEAILRLQAARQKDDEAAASPRTVRYHWRALLQCLRHPYLQMLECAPQSDAPVPGEADTLRLLLVRMEESLRGGTRFVSPHQLLEKIRAEVPAPLTRLATKILCVVVNNFAAARTPAHMGQAIGKLCHILLRYGGDTWERYPLDAESLYRIVAHVIPGLKGSALAHTSFPPSALHSLTRQLLRAERVPFEADPIAGLQVLGMLETRLLHFERLLILDATDDQLPGFTAQDPLLPDALRGLLGLPDALRRERTAAHTLYRLMAGAAEVHFFWQEGIQRSSLFDGKKSRSRFVDDLIWQEEQRRGSLVQPGSPPLHTAPCPVQAMHREATPLPVNEALRQRLRHWLERGISPTRLDSYLTCPLRFAWESLYNLRPLDEVNEGDDPAAVGKLIHDVLHTVYHPWLNKPLRSGDITPDLVEARFLEALEAPPKPDASRKDETSLPLRELLPPDSYIMLSLAGPLRLARYLKEQPEQTRVLLLEETMSAPLLITDAHGQTTEYTLKGTLDRVDARPDPLDAARERLVVLDYKTGHVRRPSPAVWTDVSFWQSLQLAVFPSPEADELLNTVAEAIPSLQLPCYLYLCDHNEDLQKLGRPGDAAWVTLRDTGVEVPLLGEDFYAGASGSEAGDGSGFEDAEALRETILGQRIPQVLAFVLQHMEKAQSFTPRVGQHCAYCPYTGLCKK